MRKAAGIVLIVLGIWEVTHLITFLIQLVIFFSFTPISVLPTILLYAIPSVFFVTGGIFCLRRKYWRACLASACFAVLHGVFWTVGPLLSPHIFAGWGAWIVLLGGVMSTIFISLTKKEWQEIRGQIDSPDNGAY
jgi:hypothetical protein